MKTCSFENQINLYLDAELSGAKLRSFEAHLQTCPRCREEVEQARELLAGLHGIEDSEVPAALQDRLHAALLSEISKGDGRVKRKFNPWALSAVAAAFLIFASVGVVLANGGFRPQQSKAAPQYNLAARSSGELGNASSSAGMVASADKGYGESAPDMAVAPSMAPVPAPNEQPLTGSGAGTTDLKDQSVRNSEFQLKSQNQPVNGLKIMYTANLVVETRDYAKCMDTIQVVLQKYGGYVENSYESGVPDANASKAGRTAVISMRMPIEKYGNTIDELKAMGNLLSKNENTEDVSRQYVDTEARNKTLILQRDKLYELLAKADKMENIIALQNEITRLTVEIEQMTSQLRFWDDKVAYSTITVELYELVTPKSLKTADPDLNTRVNGAFYKTLNDMNKGLEDFAIGFVGFLPWLAIILVMCGVLAAIVIPVTRRARKAAIQKKSTDKPKEE